MHPVCQRTGILKLTSHVEYSTRRAHDEDEEEEEDAAILNRAAPVARSMEDDVCIESTARL